MTHAELIERGAKWLRDSKRCGVVLSERESNGERPDLIGWRRDGFSYLIECKASRADFIADASKRHRYLPSQAMGNWRYYLSAPALLSLNMIPERWGLLEAHPSTIRTVVAAEETCAGWTSAEQMRREMCLLVSELSRYQIHGLVYPKLQPVSAVSPFSRQRSFGKSDDPVGDDAS